MSRVAPRFRLPTSLSVLGNRDFRLYWLGQAVSLSGTWGQNMAQSWLVLGLTSSALALGLVNFAMAIPTLLLALVGGAAADRIDKRQILLVSQAGMMALALLLGLLVWLDVAQFWMVLVVATALGIATAYDLPANQALVPELVERHEMSRAIALNSAIFHGSRLVGPALAGLLIAAVGLAGAFFANGVSFLAVIASLLAIRSRSPAPAAMGGSQLQQVAAGLRYVRGQPVIRHMLLLTALTAAFVFPCFAVLLPIYTRDVLHGEAAQLGLLMGASGLGSLIGSLALMAVSPGQRLRRIQGGTAVVVAAIVVLGLTGSLPLALGAVAALSLAVSLTMGLANTVVQEQVDPPLRGRVMGLYSLTFMGVIPFSGLATTALTDLFGLPPVLFGCALLYSLAAGLLLLRPSAAVQRPEAASASAR